MNPEDTRHAQPPDSGAAPGRMRLGWLALVVALFAATRLVTVYTDSINWDEFAMFASVDRILGSGVFRTGGHLGLARLLLVPIAESCVDEIAAVRGARLLWLGLTGAFLLGLAALLRKVQAEPRRRFWDAAVGVALLALLPVFLEWSIQVRADQFALAAGVWGGLAFLASQDRSSLRGSAGLAFLAGALLGVGWLGSRKVAYVAILVVVLALGRLWIARSQRTLGWKLKPAMALTQNALRVLVCAMGFVAVFYTYRAALEAAPVTIPTSHGSKTILSGESIESGLAVFDYYRKTIGYSQYKALLPTLGPHFAMLTALVVASVAAIRRRVRAESLLLAWSVLAAGFGVGWFHAGAFSYFWMTLGIFPAAAFAVSRWDIQRLVLPERGGIRNLAIAGWWMLLVLPGAGAALVLLNDSQQIQRESMAFIHDNFDRSASGFHPEGSLFCQEGIQPLGTFFSQTIFHNFATSESRRERRIADFLTAHREKPVHFLVQSFRLNQFPQILRQFWSDNYQPYRASVFVAGRHLEGARGTTSEFELIVAGEYRWLPKTGPQKLWIQRRDLDKSLETLEAKDGSDGQGGQLLEPGQVVTLEAGTYSARFVEDVPEGMLVLAMNEPPGLAPLRFYKRY